MFSGRRALRAVGLDVGEGQKLVDAAHGMSGDELGQDVGEVGVGIDVVELAGGNQRGEHGPVLGAAVGPGEQMVPATERDRPDGALDDVAVELDAAVVEEAAQPLPARQRVANLGKLVGSPVGQSGVASDSLQIADMVDQHGSRIEAGTTKARGQFLQFRDFVMPFDRIALKRRS